MVKHGALVVEDLHMTHKTAEGLVWAVSNVTFSVKPGEFCPFLGASGCGKTTVLRCIAGLESPNRGHIAIGDQVVFSSAERIAEPTLLLLNEPLSNLDAKLRAEMRLEITSLVKVLGVTTLYVTHDQTEALTMSDPVAVMKEGSSSKKPAPNRMP
jgi:ABC-type Fe3+/spermidine/putrescine transport system ATPase subunit